MNDLSALRRVLAADLLATHEQIRNQLPDLKMPDSIIDVVRYTYARLYIELGEAGQLTDRAQRWAHDFERRYDGEYLMRLRLALGVVERAGEGADPQPLAEYLAAEPLTMDEQKLLADFIGMFRGSKPRGFRGKGKVQIKAAAEKSSPLK